MILLGQKFTVETLWFYKILDKFWLKWSFWTFFLKKATTHPRKKIRIFEFPDQNLPKMMIFDTFFEESKSPPRNSDFVDQILPKMIILDTVEQRQYSQGKIATVYGGTFYSIIIARHLRLLKATPSPKSERFQGVGG